MFKRIIHFIKYNNATVLILALFFVAGTGVFAQTPTGQEVIGHKEISIAGEDNSRLLEADLDNLNMDFKVERIEQDDKYYYVYYTYLDLVKNNSVWEYQINEKVRKVSLGLKEDLGKYLAEELREEYEARIKELRQEQERAQDLGRETRTETTEYGGLIGQTLDLAEKIFPGYEAIKTRELPSPDTLVLPVRAAEDQPVAGADDLTRVYDDYIARMDPDEDNVFGVVDNCPDMYNPDQADSDNNGIGNVCDIAASENTDSITDSTTTSEKILNSGTEAATSTDVEKKIEEILSGTSTVDVHSGASAQEGGAVTADEPAPEPTPEEAAPTGETVPAETGSTGENISEPTVEGEPITGSASAEPDVEIIEIQ